MRKRPQRGICLVFLSITKIVECHNRITVQSNKQPMRAPPSVFPQINPPENKQTNKGQFSNTPRPAREPVGIRGMQRANKLAI